MTTNNNQTTSNDNNQPKNMKLIGTIFSYGGVQKATGNPIVTFVVSNPYEVGKNLDGTAKLEWNKVLEASLILQKEVAKDLPWEQFVTKAGKKGVRARVSFYGTLDIDRREQEKDKPQEFKFWLNPIVRDGRQMVFGLVKRAGAPAPAKAKRAAIPGDNTPSPKTRAASDKVKTASTKAKAKVTPVSADADAALPY